MDTKKKIIILAVCVLVVILAICGIVGIVKSDKQNNNDNVQNDLNIITEEAKAYYEANVADYIVGEKVLVLFFSWDGHTETLADEITMKTHATSMIIDTEDEYPLEYEECYRVAETQKAENARPALKDLGVNLADYNTIFIGYPIWLDDMPMPIYTLLENNDFSGKTVIPFATSKSSGESGTFETIRNILNTANVLDGIHFSEEAINNNTFIEETDNWVENLPVKF